MIHSNNRTPQGFTLIELLLAMTFFATILLVSTAVVVQVLGIYSKGVVVKQMNSVGRSLTDDIIRTGNSSNGFSVSPSPDPLDPSKRLRCLKIGQSVYIWSYADDTNGTEVYQFDGAPVNLSKYVNDACPQPSDSLDPSKLQPLLANNARVYLATVKTKEDSNLVGLKLVIGTYSPLIPEVNPIVNDGNVTCSEGSLGNFCAFSSYETVLYLPN